MDFSFITDNIFLLSAYGLLLLMVLFMVLWMKHIKSPQYQMERYRRQSERVIQAGEACSENALVLMNEWKTPPEEITSNELICITRDEASKRLDNLAGIVSSYGEKLRETNAIPPAEYIDLISRLNQAHQFCGLCWQNVEMKEGCAMAHIISNGSPYK